MRLATRTVKALGTSVAITIGADEGGSGSVDGLLLDCTRELERIEAAFSRFRADSMLSKHNLHLGVWQKASPEYLKLAAKAEEFHAMTEGYFDASLKAALDYLGYDANYSFRQAKGDSPLPREKDEQAMQIDWKRGEILLFREIEFGGLGKGYALDRLATLIEAGGASHYCVNAGGDVIARRGKGGEPWKIILEHPDDLQKAIGTVELDGNAIAGSAPNRRKWEGGNHHLLNAKTGKPAQGMKAIFVTAKTGIEADAFATAMFTAGMEECIRLAARLPVEVMAISAEDKVFQSKGFKADLFD